MPCGRHLSQPQVPTPASKLHSPPPPNQPRDRILFNLRRGRPLLAVTGGVRSSSQHTSISSSDPPPSPGYSNNPSLTSTPTRVSVGNPAQLPFSAPPSQTCVTVYRGIYRRKGSSICSPSVSPHEPIRCPSNRTST